MTCCCYIFGCWFFLILVSFQQVVNSAAIASIVPINNNNKNNIHSSYFSTQEQQQQRQRRRRRQRHLLQQQQQQQQQNQEQQQEHPSNKDGIENDTNNNNTNKRVSRLPKSITLFSSTGTRGGSTDHNSSAWVDGLKNSLASSFAAALSKTILAPFDTIKTLQQYYNNGSSAAAGSTSISLVEASKIIMKRPGGFLNFYAGLGVSVVGAMPSVAMYFGMYSYCKKTLLQTAYFGGDDNNNGHKTLAIALSAAVGNTFASFSRVPYEVLKQKLQTDTYRNTWEALNDIKSLEMIFPKGGVYIQMLRDIPYAVVTLLLYESLQSTWKEKKLLSSASSSSGNHNFRNNKAYSDLLIGGISGGFGSWVTNPLDVIKTRLQTSSLEVYNGSITKCIQDAYAEGGVSVFLRGSWPRLMHKVPANAFFFLFYEFFKRVLNCNT